MSEAIIFEPREHPGVVSDKDTIIVTTNHLGADMRGDAGLDAQYLADLSGHRVIGLKRLGSGDAVDYSRSLAKEITNSPEAVTERWYSVLDPALRKEAPSRVELLGRSAGAGLMLHVAALELIPETTGILAIEALRLQRVNTRRGQMKYVHYQLRREGNFKADIDSIVDQDLQPSTDPRPAEAADAKLMIRRQLKDIRHYQHLWASDLALKNAVTVARNDKLTASFVFAEVSMAADPGKLDGYLNQIRAARLLNANNALSCEVAPRTTHGSFDDQRLYATYYCRFTKLFSDSIS